MNNRILFAGTPEISVPLLKELNRCFTVVGVLTATDKMQGRSSALVPSPVKTAAIEMGLPVLQFDTLKSDARKAVKELKADTLVTFAYGKIFGPMFLELFSGGTFNVHPSALPVFRGPSPIQATILNGLENSCISVQKVGTKMDEGDVFATIPFSLEGTETDASLTEKVSLLAAEKVPEILKDVFEGKLKGQPQVGEASYCSLIDKSMAHIDFSKSVREVHSLIRGLSPWPKASALVTSASFNDKQVFFTGVWGGYKELSECKNTDTTEPGKVVEVRKDRGIGISCADGVVWITSLQLPGKKEMDFKSFINGNQWIKNAKFN